MFTRLRDPHLNSEVLAALDVHAGQSVLEIGSGTGHALQVVARRAVGGRVLGVDISELMANLARDRNRRGPSRASVEVRVGDIATLPLESTAFDRIFAVHCIYFWRDAEAVLAKLATSLKPGGRFVLAFRPEGDDIPERFRDAIYRFPRLRELEAVLNRVGLSVERSTESAAEPGVVLIAAVRS